MPIKGSKQRNLTIDVIRLILAALIVYMHVADGLLFNNRALNANASIADFCILIVARLAVPTFFAISGYYFFKKRQSDEYSSAIKNMKRLFLLFMGGLTICFITPFALLGVHKAIMMTFENYKYSQDNFEKLYKQRFEKDKAYIRSVQYNKEMAKKNKK